MPRRPDGRTKLGRFAPGKSGNPSGVRRDAARAESPQTSRARRDEWRNAFTGQGMFGRDKRIGATFDLHPLNFDQLMNLYLGDDLASRAVETIPKAARRQGYDISITQKDDEDGAIDPHDLAAQVKDKLDLLGADQMLETVGNYERAYGGGAILLGVNDKQDDLTKPLDLNKVTSFDYLTPLEARECLPLYAYNDPRQPKYGQPEIYQLQSRSILPSFGGNTYATTMQIHESRLIPFTGIRVSRYQTTTARGGWGESVLTRVWRVLRDFNTAWSSAGVLVTDFAQSVIKIAGLWEALAEDGDDALQNRLNAMDRGRSTINAITIDADDEYSRQQTPITGLPDLLEKFAIRLAAACDMPLTLLFGTSPSGLNATGESDIRMFYDRVAAYQQQTLDPALRRLIQVIFRTLENRHEPEKWSIQFRPLWQESAKDKAAAMFQQAQADNLWVGMGAISPEEVSSSHWGKGEWDPNLAVDFDMREEQEQAVAPPVLSDDDLDALKLPPDYVPPPGPGSTKAPRAVPPPGPAAAPDPNTPARPTVKSEDAADRARRDDQTNAGESVLQQLAADFPPESLMWVRQTHWTGPSLVPVDEVDFANAENWKASREPDKVDKFAKRIAGGWYKPIILVKRPGERELMIADGHHRALAYRKLNRPMLAYIAHVATDDGPWDEFHSSQHESESAHADEWSDAAREAAAEARKQGASQQGAKAAGHAAAARQASEKAKKSSKAEDHRKAAQAHEQASRSFERAGQKYAGQASEHEKAAAEHREHAPVTSKAKTEHVPAKVEHGSHGEGGPHSEGKHPAGSEGRHGKGHAKGEHAKGHEGGKHGELGKMLKEGVSTVGGKEAGEAAGAVAGGEGEGEE